MYQVLLFLLILVTSIFYFYLRRTFSYWEIRGIPYEEPSVILGNLSFLMRKSFYEYFYELRQKHQTDFVGAFFGWRPTLIVQTPQLARDILVKHSDNFQDRSIYSSCSADPLGALNLFTLRNPLWKTMRHELSPVFTSSRLKSLTELMNNNAKELIMKIKRDHIYGNEPVNLKDLFSMYTSDTVGSTVFGIRVSALNDPRNPLWFITRHMVKWTFWRGLEFTVIFFIPVLAEFLRLKLFSEAASVYVKKLFWDVVKKRNANGKTNDNNLVDHMLKLRENLKLPAGADSQLAEDLMLAQVAVFIFGSIETSSSTLIFLLYELAHHPEEQEKLYQEINEAFKRTKNYDALDYEELFELKYTTACILETLRKYPPSTSLDRICNKTCQLTDDVTVEQSTPVFINVVALHYDPERFPEPEEWKPERMYDVSEYDNLQYSYLPFGGGARYCIGKRYGSLQLRAAFTQIIHKYKLLPEANLPSQMEFDPYSVLMAPKYVNLVKFELR